MVGVVANEFHKVLVYIYVQVAFMLGNERIMQSISKVTRHGSEATISRQIRRVHEDLRAHQSYQTDFRQALTHIHDMGAHLAAI